MRRTGTAQRTIPSPPSGACDQEEAPPADETAGAGPVRLRVLMIVENLPVPFDRRVWQEARALRQAGCTVSVICPKGYGHSASHEVLEDINIYRHGIPIDASGLLGYALEYSVALFWEFVLSLRVLRRHGFDVIHACNPPDLIFLVGLFHKVFFRKKFLFDHHDISPELYESKFGRRGPMHRLLLFLERCTFRCADASIATNESFRKIAIERCGMDPRRVWVVKSYPDLARFRRVPPDPGLKNGRSYLIGYVGIMGRQDGVDRLVRAMDHIVHARGRNDIGCAIIGNGPELESLKRLASELRLDGHIEFTGYLTGHRLLTHLSTVDVGVIPDPPDIYNDKISMNKVFEYMSLGIPFVQYDVTESRQTAGDAALIACGTDGPALGDALLELIDAPERRRSMAEIGRTRAAAEFRWETQVQALLEAYSSLDASVQLPSGGERRAYSTT